MYVRIIVQHEFRDAFLVLSRRRRPTNCWILSFRIGIGITKSFQFDISANTIRCDGPQFCILKVMVFGIVCIIPPSHKCNEEGPILCMGSSTFLVHWNDNIGGIHIGPSRPAATASGPSRPAPGPMPTPGPTPTTTSPGPSPSAAKRYSYPVTTTFIVTG